MGRLLRGSTWEIFTATRSMVGIKHGGLDLIAVPCVTHSLFFSAVSIVRVSISFGRSFVRFGIGVFAKSGIIGKVFPVAANDVVVIRSRSPALLSVPMDGLRRCLRP